MSNLLTQQCSHLSGDKYALSDSAAVELLQQLEPRWTLNKDNHSITFSYNFKDYYQTIAFVNVIAQIAHQQNHHPELHISYGQCTVVYSTHSVDGLSINDFICAAKINAAQNL